MVSYLKISRLLIEEDQKHWFTISIVINILSYPKLLRKWEIRLVLVMEDQSQMSFELFIATLQQRKSNQKMEPHMISQFPRKNINSIFVRNVTQLAPFFLVFIFYHYKYCQVPKFKFGVTLRYWKSIKRSNIPSKILHFKFVPTFFPKSNSTYAMCTQEKRGLNPANDKQMNGLNFL